ncbi:HD domain-containing protein [Desulfosarcina sp. OttesenSCG-928-G17]|nr:HD domain-containing protein [Desulfosarcina sp. OttesenSCG-928-G17]
MSHRPRTPTEKECEILMREKCAVPENIISHCQKVAEVADALTCAVNEAGAGLDANLIRSACLVHDVARLEKNHGRAAAELLRSMGFSEMADVVEVHMDVPVFPDDPLDEIQMVFYADKLVMNTKVVSVGQRFAAKARQHGHNPASLENIHRRETAALEVQAKIEKLTGKSVSEILSAAGV